MKCLELSAWHITGNQEMFTIIIIVSIKKTLAEETDVGLLWANKSNNYLRV